MTAAKRMPTVKGWATVHTATNSKPMIQGDYDQEQMTVYYRRPTTDMLDEHVVRVEIREIVSKRKTSHDRRR